MSFGISYRWLRKCVFIFFITLAFSSCTKIFNKKTAKKPVNIKKPIDIKKGFPAFLWKAEKNGKVAYLFGTMHFPGLSLSDFPKEISDYIKNSQTFFVESDFSKESPKATPLPEKKALDKTLSKKSWDKLKAFYRGQLSTQGVNDQKMEKALHQILEKVKLIKPVDIYISIDISAFFEAMKNYSGKDSKSLANQKTLVHNTFSYAKSVTGLQVSFFEDPDTVLTSLEKAHPVEDFDSLLSKYNTLQELVQERVKRNYGQIVCYKKADLACLKRELLIEQSSLFKNWHKMVIVERHKNWIPIIEKSVETGVSFIAVGVSHFIGEDNILELLKERGFSIERI